MLADLSKFATLRDQGYNYITISLVFLVTELSNI